MLIKTMNALKEILEPAITRAVKNRKTDVKMKAARGALLIISN